MATFGKTTVGATADRSGVADRLYASKYALAESAVVSQISWYGALDMAGNVRMGLYADDAGGSRPGTLLGYTSTIAVGTTDAWWTANLVSPVTLAAGNYWLGFHVDQTVDYYYDSTGSTYGVADVFANGLDNPAPGGGASYTREISIYATYGYPRTAAVAYDGGGLLSATATVVSGAPVISAPSQDQVVPEGDVTATAAVTHPLGSPVRYEWEFDRANPPAPESPYYQSTMSGLVPSGTAASVLGVNLTPGTWYCRVRGTDDTTTSAWSPIRSFLVLGQLRLLPGAAVKTSILPAANRVYALVERSSPLVTATATYDQAGDPLRYSAGPREAVVPLKSGDAAAAQAVADLQLAYRRQPRVVISGCRVSMHAGGIAITRDRLLGISHAKSGVTGVYPVRRLVYDFAADTVEVELGDFDLRARDDQQALVTLAKRLQQLERESTI